MEFTAGESLYQHLENKLFGNMQWGDFKKSLAYSSFSEELADLFNQIVITNLTGRLVIAGASLANKHGMDNALFESDLNSYITEKLGIPYALSTEIKRRTISAVVAARSEISKTTKNRIEAWSKNHGSQCYICGVGLDFRRSNLHNSFTCEHIWPNSYGGDSEEYNLLPACHDCNGKKADYAMWAMPAVQSLILGFVNPTGDKLDKIQSIYKIALHHRAGYKYARKRQVSLKQAFIEIGPWQSVRLFDTDDTAHFFNLENHQQLRNFRFRDRK